MIGTISRHHFDDSHIISTSLGTTKKGVLLHDPKSHKVLKAYFLQPFPFRFHPKGHLTLREEKKREEKILGSPPAHFLLFHLFLSPFLFTYQI